MSETLYRKVGRKYVPAFSSVHDRYDYDLMEVGTFRLTYAYSDGGRRYAYDVKPDTAGFVAAAMLYKQKMEAAINDASIAKPQLGTVTPYTRKQLNLIEQFRKDMAEAGGLTPTHWTHATAYQISEAAINAMKGEP